MEALSRYVYGTTRLGDESVAFGDRVAFVRGVIARGLSLHTSDQYGDTLAVLKAAFAGGEAPPTIFKIGWSSAAEVEGQVMGQLTATGLARMAVGQLCPGGALAEEIRSGEVPAGSPSDVAALLRLKEEGIVGSYLMEVWPWTSDVAVGAMRAGRLAPLVDGLIFYFNPLQRFVTNELWDLAHERRVPVVAMRTTAGGTAEPPEWAPEYLKARAAQVRPIFARSGCASWTEFCVRFALGYPGVRATVGATLTGRHLDLLAASVEGAAPLEAGVVEEIEALQRRWSVEHDVKAAAWSM